MPYDIGKLRYWQGKHLSALHKLKIRKSLSKSRKKRSLIMKKLFLEGKIKPPWKGKKLPFWMRKKISATKKKQTSSAEYRRKTSRFFKKYWKEHPAKLQAVLKKTIYLWKRNPELQEKINRKISYRGKLRFKNVREKIRIKKAVKEFWRAHPELNAKWRKRFNSYYFSNPKARKKLLKNQKNPFNADIKTKSGYFVRSLGEKKIADFLFSAKIEFEYEKQPLLLSEQLCIPDFYLPAYKIFIEFYGGYPMAWKKKVLKNKLYKKYKIPCIFITPAELLNLNYYLLKEIYRLSKSEIAKNFILKKFQR